MFDLKRLFPILAVLLCAVLFGALAEARSVAPIPNAVDVTRLPDGVYPVAFDREDVLADSSGITMNGVHVFTRDRYDPDEVNALEVGDTIIVDGGTVPVLTLETDDFGITVNGEQDARAFYLVTEEGSGVYVVRGMNDLGTFTELGVATLTVDPSATFTDGWDIEREPVTVGCEDIAGAIRNSENDSFVPDNASLRVEGGRVVEIVREYMP